ncbi:MAG: outer membrane protein assembly factor [Rhodobacteraceae bacterium]|nr:outer membrane protein assembly factor [Paracoccaceae bacterium]
MGKSILTPILAAWVVCLAVAQPAAATDARLTAPGAPDGLKDALRAASLSLVAVEAEDATPQDILAAARADYARLIGALYAQGYYGPVIHIRLDGREAADIAPLSVPARIARVEIAVDPGAPFAFARAQIGPLAPGTALPEGFAPGQRARSTAIRDAAQAGVTGWRAASHAKARVAAQRLTADHPRATLDAVLDLDPGPSVVFGDLLIEGTSAVRPERLRAIAGLPLGAPFDPAALETSATRLRRTGAFRSVRLAEGETLGPDNGLDIGLRVVDEKPRRFGAGIELSSLEGGTLSGFWMHRNLLGGAERLRFDAGVSGLGGSESGGVDYNLSARFDRPAVINADTGLYAQAALQTLDEPDYREDTGQFEVGLTHIFSERLSGEIGLGLRYSDVSDDLGRRSMGHLVMPARLTWDGRDSVLSARSGFYLDLEALPLAAVGGAAENGARLSADARAYRGLGDRLVLAGRLQLGSIIGASADGVPPDLLFFSGGGGTVRGQPYQSLAVELGSGDRIGGRAFLGLSGEARVDLRGALGMVAFADAGYIGEGSLGGSGDWHAGAGLGLRYDTGIGPIRLDLAVPVRGNTGDGMQIYIGIGQAF